MEHPIIKVLVLIVLFLGSHGWVVGTSFSPQSAPVYDQWLRQTSTHVGQHESICRLVQGTLGQYWVYYLALNVRQFKCLVTIVRKNEEEKIHWIRIWKIFFQLFVCCIQTDRNTIWNALLFWQLFNKKNINTCTR